MELVLDELTAASPAESGASCSLENYLALPDHTMDDRIAAARKKLGSSTIMLGHHYQRDEVIRFADFTGDSYKLSKAAAETDAKYIVFCGVHFMAESADILGRDGQQVILPDLNAGCSMADMAEISQVEACWEALERLGLTADTIPLTYMNSTAAIKAFCGERGGLVCTSSNARSAFEWAFARGKRILFLPDQHLGRNTGYAMGIPMEEMSVWDPWALEGGQTAAKLASSRLLLWKGHCSVHQRFLPGHVDAVRDKYPGIQVIVHPECRWEVCQKADALGSTERLIALVEEAPAGDQLRHRHRDSSRQPAGQALRRSGQKDHLPRRTRLPVHHHVPHQPPAPCLGSRKPGRRPRRESHPGPPQRQALGPRRPGPHAGSESTVISGQ